MIQKLIKIDDDSYANITEYPDDLISLEGIRGSKEDGFLRQSILFTRKAMTAMLPEIQAWLDKGD